MDTFSILVIVTILLLLVAYLVQPFLTRARDRAQQHSPAAGGLRQRADLLARRNENYRAILDLDFDHSTGKVADDDYEQQRRALVSHGIDLLQQLDGLPDAPGSDAIEAAVAALRQGLPAVSGAGQCPHCGQPTQPDDRFCGSCGGAL